LSQLSAFNVAPVKDDILIRGCDECHFVYQAELLPERSWEKMFVESELNDHFGKKVVLTEQLRERFLDYYLNNASDSKNGKARKKIDNSIPMDRTLLRISQVPYIKSKHKDLPEEMFLKNDKVKSYANCTACHKAERGEYEEDDVEVPNWEKSFFFGWEKR
jgi:hypothetical protein